MLLLGRKMGSSTQLISFGNIFKLFCILVLSRHVISHSTLVTKTTIGPPVKAKTADALITEKENLTPKTVTDTTFDQPSSSSNVNITPTTAVPPTITSPVTPKTVSNLSYCPCNLKVTTCDTNCCCDPDCDERQREVFTFCADVNIFKSDQKQYHCHRKDYFFRNNTPFLMEVHSNGLFCIVTSNLHQEEELPDLRIDDIRSSLKDYKPRYSWSLDSYQSATKATRGGYKVGSSIEVIKVYNASKYEQGVLWLPSVFYGTSCLAKEPIKFLKDARSRCQEEVSDLLSECSKRERLDVNTFLKDLYIIRNPKHNLTVDNLVNFTFMTCVDVDSVKTCNETDELMSPAVEVASSSCSNVLSILDLVFIHLGVEGIIHVTAKIQYGRYSVSTKQTQQEFRTTFLWGSDGEENDPISYVVRSGNPGYILGRPVISGRAVLTKFPEPLPNPTDEIKETNTGMLEPKKRIVSDGSSRESNWMRVLSPGVCSEERKPVLFGMDVNVMCRVDIAGFKSCQALQLEIGKILLGTSPNNFGERVHGPPLSAVQLKQTQPWPMHSRNH